MTIHAHRYDRRAAWLVVLAGVSAAIHVGKLPPAVPVLQQELGITLVQAGFLLSLVQLAAMTLGLALGLAADRFGLRRSMLLGLGLLTVAGMAGGWVRSAAMLMLLRGLEGLGFLLASLAAPGLLRRLLPPSELVPMLGVWGAYMPFGTALALLLGPVVMAGAHWEIWWWLVAAGSGAAALAVSMLVPPDPPVTAAATGESWSTRLRSTLEAPGPWLLALTFMVYSAQWLAIIGFLPAVYGAAGLRGAVLGALTALVAAMNIVGNLLAGRLLHEGANPRGLLLSGFAVMAVSALVAFAELGQGAVARYVAMLAFSAVGGLIPGTLFVLVPRLAPSPALIATTVGWMQQGSSLGQFAGPPLVAALAGAVGGWQYTWVITGSCCVMGVLLALRLGRVRLHVH